LTYESVILSGGEPERVFLPNSTRTAVEGPAFIPATHWGVKALVCEGKHPALQIESTATLKEIATARLLLDVPICPRRSFDCGSSHLFLETISRLASAQDDGASALVMRQASKSRSFHDAVQSMEFLFPSLHTVKEIFVL
jgi:hypothetical protein